MYFGAHSLKSFLDIHVGTMFISIDVGYYYVFCMWLKSLVLEVYLGFHAS
jgi:hypothetical protein